MSWWGKIIGGSFGFLAGGPLGAMLGAALGHQFDQGMKGMGRDQAGFGPGDQQRIQGAFFTATFSVMGHIAKADGNVSREEINTANAVMQQMGLNEQMKAAAKSLFNQGKQADFPLDDVLSQLRRECHRRDTLLRMFLEIQLHAAYADEVIHPAERQLLEYICQSLGFSAHEFAHLEAMVKAQGRSGGGQVTTASSGLSIEEAYAVLDVAKTATDAEVKKAYRRLMSQHHPDKLIAKGLPEEMMQVAKEKTQEIKACYDMVKESRGMR